MKIKVPKKVFFLSIAGVVILSVIFFVTKDVYMGIKTASEVEERNARCREVNACYKECELKYPDIEYSEPEVGDEYMKELKELHDKAYQNGNADAIYEIQLEVLRYMHSKDLEARENEGIFSKENKCYGVCNMRVYGERQLLPVRCDVVPVSY